MAGRRFLSLVLIGLLLMGILSAVHSSAFRAGWSEGYLAGQGTVDSETRATVPHAPYGPGERFFPGWNIWPLWGAALFFKFLLFVFVLGMIGRFFFHHHGMRRGSWHKREHEPHIGYHHGYSKAWRGDDMADDEQVMKV